MHAFSPERYTLLTVAEKPGNHEALIAILTRAGYAPHSTPAGDTAPHSIPGPPPDLAILDMESPDLQSWLKLLGRPVPVPVIFTEAGNDPEERKRAFRSGGEDFLPRPWCEEEVLSRIEGILYRRHLEKEVALGKQRLEVGEERFQALLQLSSMQKASRRELANYVLETAVRLTGSRVGYLHFIHDDQQNIELFTWSKETVKNCTAAPTSHYPVTEAGVWADSVRYRKAVIHNDYPALEGRKGYPEGHFPVSRHMSVPVFDGNRVKAVVGVGNSPEPYGEFHVRQLTLFLNSMWNILKEKRSKEALARSENRYRKIFNAINDSLLIIRFDGTIMEANRTACLTYGYEAAEFPGIPLSRLVSPDHHPLCDELLASVKKGGEFHGERTDVTRNGAPFHCEVSGSAIEYAGEPHLLVIVRDITERQKAEEEQRRLSSRLRQSQKMEAIGTLAGGIAHDFNNILTAIFGYGQMVLENLPEGSRDRKRQEHVINAGVRARDLVSRILAFSRSGEVEHLPIRPDLVIKEALKLLRPSIPTTIDIQGNISPNCGMILADPTQLHQVVMNLCTNAYQAMMRTGGILAVSMTPVRVDEGDLESGATPLSPGSYLKLEVSDTGHGMDQKTLESIFDPYFTTKKKGEGTGLGLSVVHGIVKSRAGHISAYSEVGKGTVFRIFFPSFSSRKTETAPSSRLPVSGGSERILVVDDEPVVMEALKAMLESLGYRARAELRAPHALARFKEDPGAYDLVITDMTMPEMTGADLSGELLSIRPSLPIILCTGFSSLIDDKGARAMGIRAFLMKPILKHQLAHTVRKALEGEGD